MDLAHPLPRLKPFLFDRDFDAPHRLDDAPNVGDESIEPAPCFTEDDLQRARAEGMAAGRAAAIAEAERALATRITLAAENATLHLQAMVQRQQRDDDEVSRQAVAVALAVCRKILPATYRETGAREITDLIRVLLPQLADRPELVLRVHGELAQGLDDALRPVFATAGFSGHVRVQPDGTLPPGDCRVEWTGGGLSRSWGDLWQAIECLALDQFGIAADRLPATAVAGLYGQVTDQLTHDESGDKQHG